MYSVKSALYEKKHKLKSNFAKKLIIWIKINSMIPAKEIVFWCLGLFFVIFLLLLLLIKFWVGRCNEYDQNGINEDELGGTEFIKEQLSGEQNHSNLQKLVIFNEKRTMRDFQHQVSFQYNEDELETTSHIITTHI